MVGGGIDRSTRASSSLPSPSFLFLPPSALIFVSSSSCLNLLPPAALHYPNSSTSFLRSIRPSRSLRGPRWRLVSAGAQARRRPSSPRLLVSSWKPGCQFHQSTITAISLTGGTVGKRKKSERRESGDRGRERRDGSRRSHVVLHHSATFRALIPKESTLKEGGEEEGSFL